MKWNICMKKTWTSKRYLYNYAINFIAEFFCFCFLDDNILNNFSLREEGGAENSNLGSGSWCGKTINLFRFVMKFLGRKFGFVKNFCFIGIVHKIPQNLEKPFKVHWNFSFFFQRESKKINFRPKISIFPQKNINFLP